MTIEVIKKVLSDGSEVFDLRLAQDNAEIILPCASERECHVAANQICGTVCAYTVESVIMV